MKKLNTALLAALITGASSFAFAHGDEAHAPPAGPVVKEQKAWGIAGDPQAVNRSITFTMTDNMRFTPDKIAVKQGETIRFVIKNSGKLMHEMVLGTRKDLDEHAALMMKFPGMAHEEPYMAHVGPGKKGEIIWTFNQPGSFDFACLMAGHYQAGMAGKISVAASTR
jgi:uncharacterized cupredoxin-like copper-binding protein